MAFAQQQNRKVTFRKRHNFSRIPNILDIPDLNAIQKESYVKFLQMGKDFQQRSDMGLEAVFRSVFPIQDYNETAQLEYISYSLGEPKYNVNECQDRGATFAAPVRIKVRLVLFEREGSAAPGERPVKDVKEQEVYLGELPLMTDKGTFIINGIERVIVSQLHRSPGVFFEDDGGKGGANAKVIYSARIIPYRGSWMDFEFDAKDILYVRIDKKRKFPATVVLKALGYSERDILSHFYTNETIRVSEDGSVEKLTDLANLYNQKLMQDILHPESGEVLVKAGHKITRGNIRKLTNANVQSIRLDRMEVVRDTSYFAEDIYDPSSGELLASINQPVTDDIYDLLLERGVREFAILFIDNIKSDTSIRDTLAADSKVTSAEEALIEIFRKMRPGEPPTVEAATQLFDNLFFVAKRYDLSRVGRLKINRRLGLEVPMDVTTLTREDILQVVKTLSDIKNGKGSVDDIDHLSNRRIRSVGELLENQFRIGLVRMERTVKERMSIQDLSELSPQELLNSKPIVASIKEFFGSSQLSQFMDQTNPLAEITHKRRLSALGPGGLTRERAGFEVRDVHTTHYGRICPIETPEGPNIGLITSLATHGRINEYGFIETPYRKVEKKKVTTQIDYLSAIDEYGQIIAQANEPLDKGNCFVNELVSARDEGEFVMTEAENITYMDVAPVQMVSVAAGLIPFLENDDANRALMGSNMQRQAVPLLRTQSPLVGTGLERKVAVDSGAAITATRGGTIVSVEADKIIVHVNESEIAPGEGRVDIYNLIKFRRSNQNTCINQTPIVFPGDQVKAGDVIADGPATESGDLALGKNVVVAFMPWMGYNFEDSILISERVVLEDVYTSIHIEEFDVEARDTKLGPEDITRDIPNVGEDALKDIDDSGIIRIGAEVKAGDIMVGKVTPKGETQPTPEEKLLRAIFGEKAGEFRDASLTVPPGIEGTIVDVKVFTRRGTEKDDRVKDIEEEEIKKLEVDYQDECTLIRKERLNKIRRLLVGKKLADDLVLRGKILGREGEAITMEMVEKLTLNELLETPVEDSEGFIRKAESIREIMEEQLEKTHEMYTEKKSRVNMGDDLPPGVFKMVKVYVAVKRKLKVGDKMAGRHGNKGVVSRILPQEDLPYLPDGTPVDIVLNPLGVPSRMNVGQILETHLGWAAKALGMHVATNVFDGANEGDIKELLRKAYDGNDTGQTDLYDGRTGEKFDQPVTVGVIYMLKLHHLVDTKIHARSTGPYSLVTQQPLGGKAQFGGQRFGEMEVWALEAYGASHCLQELLTVKSDDVNGRTKMYEAIVKGENTLTPGLPESFNVLVKELQSLCLDVELISTDEAVEVEAGESSEVLTEESGE
ncbi:DNA-directed RNA polymerase, beta subunit [Desulfurispirillum indicum S5]|uniref:DNA-directed RNA polymerase subunit beta n=1 Tax=Desulfurispirillum indicum (strain ATCC BAA-1389 / DSM 22839 / S5) TaxID=653733 RepID=E6W244_DESIS|nr:DNA-directed RNA polymerase subunit beta [Desulfurispirillum indicum]ADU66670.1 DNA-directed RNA polymerase, beta subunit [Desulfurispirillum indicum S5]